MNEFQQNPSFYPAMSGAPGPYGAYGQQLAPQGILGGFLGGPLGGLIGKGIGGLFGNPSLGGQIGQIAGGIGGSILPFSADPTAAYAQQLQQLQQLQQSQQPQQFGPQGWLGNLIGQVGQPLGGAIGGMLGNAGLGTQIGGVASQLGRMLPFNVDPLAAYGQQFQQQPQQQQFGPQGWVGNLIGQVGQPLGGAIGGMLGNAGLGTQIGGIASQLGRMLPFNVDPLAAYGQQFQPQQQQLQPQSFQPQQFGPQGWLGNLIGQVGQPLGGAIGGMLGNAGLGSQIGGVASQLGRMLPFNVDPLAAYAQQLQQQQQQQPQPQQQQFGPQGWVGNLIGQVGQPLGGAIGGMLGNAGLGTQIGGIASQLGRMLPFNVDPLAAYGQQLQQAQLQQQLAQLSQQSGGLGSQPTLH